MKNVLQNLMLFGLIALVVTGCNSRRPYSSGTYNPPLNREYLSQNPSARQSTFESRRTAPASLPAAPVRKYTPPPKAEPAPVAAAVPAAMTEDGELLPPNAKPGECYARVLVPPTYDTVTEEILVEEASERIDILPAKFEWVEEEVLVQEASEELVVIPAEYNWVEEEVVVESATSEAIQVPAEYEWREEQVLVKPAHTVWKKGRGPLEKIDDGTGEIMCLVEVPAVYETVKKKVMISEARTEFIQKPAVTEMVKKKVMISPPRTETKIIPAEYKTVRVRKMVMPEQQRTIPTEAKYDLVEKRVMVSPGRVSWRRVLCETNLKPDVIKQIQEALTAQGYDPGPVDGILGGQTRIAVESYQHAQELAKGGLTYETLDSLGITVARLSN